MTGKRRLGDQPQPPERPKPAFPTSGVIGPRKTRRELRAERRRQQRRRLGAAGIAGLVAVGLAAAAAITFGVKQVTSDDPKPVLGQTTVLFSLADTDHVAVETALLAHDSRTHRGVELLLPARLLTEVCGFGNQQLGQVLALPDGPRLSRTVVGELLGGVSIDGSWVLTTFQLARLIDEVGGITVDVDVDVIQRKSDGSRVLLVPHGPDQHLSGSRAVAFATYSGGEQDAAGNLVRLQQVIDGLLAALPRDADEVQRKIASQGKSASSTLGAEQLADVLVGLAADNRANTMLPADLPVLKIDSGKGPPSYRVDVAQTNQLVSTALGPSLPSKAAGERKRVLVQNGVGTPGLVPSACSKLVAAGFAFAGSGNARSFDFKTSKVLVFDRSVPTAQLGASVARALGLPADDVAVSTEAPNVADVLVILGKDYKP